MAEPSPDPYKFEQAIAAWHKRVPMTKDEWSDLEKNEREFAFTVANIAQIDIVNDVWSAIDRAIERGDAFDEFQEAVGSKLAKEWGEARPARIETIFRTNLQTAYNAGRHAIYSSPAVKEARPYLRFDAIHDDATDDECEECDDVVLPQDDPWWDEHSPILHPNCRCVLTPLTPEEVEEIDGPDSKGPEVEIDEGFGSPPSEEGAAWEPDTSGYPPELREIIDAKLGDD